MSRELVTKGSPITWALLDRSFGGRAQELLAVNDETGEISITTSLKLNGVALTGTQNVAGDVVATGDVSAATLHVSGASTLHAVSATTLTTSGVADISAGAKLPATAFHSFCSLGADASGGATHITATGVKVGDKVIMVANVTDHTSVAADFEATVTVNDQIQQSAADLSAKTLVILVLAQS